MPGRSHLLPRAAGLALGSNLGDRLAHLAAARDALKELAAPGEFLQAPIFATAPVDCPDGSPDFLNTVVEFPFAGTPEELLDATQAIERQLGREPRPLRNAPRPIDLDLLYLGDLQHQHHRLQLPHPRLHLRRFVLEPLAGIRPRLVLPGHRLDVAAHLAALDSSEPPLRLVTTRW